MDGKTSTDILCWALTELSRCEKVKKLFDIRQREDIPVQERVVVPPQQPAAIASKRSELDILCWAISELERREKSKKCVDVRQRDNIPLQDRLVKLIGRKPLFQCELDDVSLQVLWDTGSMISMIDSEWVQDHCPDVELRPISDFIDDEDSVEFVAANNTIVPMIGCVVLRFTMGSTTFPVPFLVTSSKMSQPIVGFNVMEHLVRHGKKEEVVDLLVNSNPVVGVKKMTVVVNMVAKNIEDDDFLGDLCAVKASVIPAKSSVRIRCRVKGDVRGLNLPFVCSETDIKRNESLSFHML